MRNATVELRPPNLPSMRLKFGYKPSAELRASATVSTRCNESLRGRLNLDDKKSSTLNLEQDSRTTDETASSLLEQESVIRIDDRVATRSATR